MNPINVLILEDREFTREVIGNYLSANLAHDASETNHPNLDLAGGELAHLLPYNWESLRPRDFRVYCAEEGEIGLLLDAAVGCDRRKRLREHVGDICRHAFVGEAQTPDVLVVDLALSDYEQGLMAKEALWPSVNCPTCEPTRPNAASDPREMLENMTGFKILRTLAGGPQIIATSFASHPHISRHCRVNGARAFVRKPVREDEKMLKEWDWITAARYGPTELKKLGEQNVDPLTVVVLDYLTTLSAEILAALPILALRQLSGCATQHAPGATASPA